MLVKKGRIVDDPFMAVADGEALPQGPVLVSLKRFQAERDALLSGGVPLAVRLETAETPEVLGADVHRLAAVVLHVPHFKDGRAFSWARLLRVELGYKGEIRVSGHVLRDQIAFYARVGVDAFDLSQNLSLADVEAALHEISNVYQPSVDGRIIIRNLRVRRQDVPA
jgi:uncharacterized protein (DUF934 family)